MAERLQENRRVILIILVALLLICLLAVLAYNVFFAGVGDNVVGGPPPTATLAPTEETPEAALTAETEVTPTPTRVISEAPTEELTTGPTGEPTAEPTGQPTDTPTPASQPSGADTTTTTSGVAPVTDVVEVSRIDNVLKNGDFEEGFDDRGVGKNWGIFKLDGANYAFSQETAEIFVQEGASAQRISVEFAVEPDRYGGIYQTVKVTPGQVYTLTLHGQIRSGFGDVLASSYGYRIQYGIDYKGGENWQTVPAAEWVELPWDEQLLNGSEFEFSEYTTQITPTSDKLTLFIRVWNKWAIPTLAEYTLDNLSLVGPVPGEVMLVSAETGEVVSTGAATGTVAGTVAGTTSVTGTATGEAIVDKPLPVTGIGASGNLMQDGRFWGGVVVLVLLGIGAIYRAKWGW
jgi:hypothetical protein